MGAWRVERGDSQRAPDPAGRAEGGRGVLAVSLHTLRVGASILRTAGSPSPPCSRPMVPHRLLPAERITAESGGLPSPPVLPLPRPQQLGLKRGFRFCLLLPSLDTGSLQPGFYPLQCVLYLPAPSTHPLSKTPGGELQAVGRPWVLWPSTPAPPALPPPESEDRSTLVGSRNSATSVHSPAGAKTGGGTLASLCRSLPGLGTMARRWGWVGGRDGGGGTENRARGQSQTSARENLLFAPSVLLRSREREPRKRRPSAKTNSARGRRRRRDKAAERETESEGRAASRDREGEEQKGCGVAPWRVGEGIPGVPAESAGAKRSWSAWLARMGSSLSPVVPAAAGAPLGCAAQAPADRRREGKVRGSEAPVGSKTYVPSACWRRLRRAVA